MALFFLSALYAGAGVCGAASVVTCAVSVPLALIGVGFITGAIGGTGLCASAGLGAAGFLTWQDNAAPDLPFAERAKMAEAHNDRLRARASAKQAPPPKPTSKKKGNGESDRVDPPAGPVGDEPPPPLATPTPSLDKPAATEQPRMRF